MISKGTTHNNGPRLANYMSTGKKGERAEQGPLRGFAATNIKDAFRDVQIMSEATKCEQPFFHVQVRNRDGERLDRQQWEYTADRIEQMLGLADQSRAICFHLNEKTGEEHMHVAWSRIDQDTMKAVPLPFFKDRLKKISRELEIHFALEPVTNHRADAITYAPTRAEEEQARRLGFDVHEIRTAIRSCYDRSDCGAGFRAALEEDGLTLARGDKRDFLVIDQAGGMHALGKRILGVSAACVRDRLSDLSREALPTVEQVRLSSLEEELERVNEQKRMLEDPHWDRDKHDRQWQDAVIKAAIEKEKTEGQFVEPGSRKKDTVKEQSPGFQRDLSRSAGEIRLAYSLSETVQEFAEALEDRGMILAHVDEREAERLNRWDLKRKKEFEGKLPAASQEHQPKAKPRFQAEDVVVVDQFGSVHPLNYVTTGDRRKAVAEHLSGLDRSNLLSVSSAEDVAKRLRQHQREERREEKNEAWRVQTNEKASPVKAPERERRETFANTAQNITGDGRVEDLRGTAADVWKAWSPQEFETTASALKSGKPKSYPVPAKEEFAQALDDKGIMFATVTAEEAAQSHKEAAFGREIGRNVPRYKEGEIVIVTEPRPEYRRDGQMIAPKRVAKIDQSLADKFVDHLGIRGELKSIGATLDLSNRRASERAIQRSADGSARGTVSPTGRDYPFGTGKASLTPARAASKVGSGLVSVLEGIFSLFDPVLTPEQKREAKHTAEQRQAATDRAIDYARFTSEQAELRRQQETEIERERGGRDR